MNKQEISDEQLCKLAKYIFCKAFYLGCSIADIEKEDTAYWVFLHDMRITNDYSPEDIRELCRRITDKESNQ